MGDFVIRTQTALLVSLHKFRELHVLPFGLQVLKFIFGKTCWHNDYHMDIKGSAGHCAFLLADYLWSSWSGILLPSLPPFTLALPCSCTSAVGGPSLSGGLELSRPTCPSYPPPGLPALVHLRMGCTFHSWLVVLPILGAFTHRLGQTLAGV